MVIAPSASDLESSKSWVRSMSVTLPMPSQRGHMQPLRLRGDRAEHQRALARTRDAGEHRQPALRDLDADVLEVVHARAVHADQIVAAGNVQRWRLRVRPRHRVSKSAY